MADNDQRTKINGFEMAYSVEGEGFPLIFAHGLMNSRWAQTEMGMGIESFENRYKVITYDARGHGESESPKDVETYNWRQLGQDMSGLLSHLNVEQAYVGGASMGCATSVAMALDSPELVKGLVLLMPPPFPDPGINNPEDLSKELAGVRQMFEMFAQLIEKQGMKAVLPLMQQQPMFADMKKSNPEMSERLMRVMAATNEEGAPLAIRGLVNNEPIDVNRFSEINVPALIVAHGGDPIHPMKSAEMLNEMLPQARLHAVDAAGHFMENPDEMLSVINEFLDDMDKA